LAGNQKAIKTKSMIEEQIRKIWFEIISRRYGSRINPEDMVQGSIRKIWFKDHIRKIWF